jgi:D-alanine-D-alanine ligase
MRIGLAFDLKSDSPAGPPAGDTPLPDDWQEEFDSPVTVRAIAAALEEAGHTIVELGDGPPLVRRLLDDPPDLVFNIAEGSGTGRDREARVPAVCEMLGIPYTGSDPLTLAVALDKDAARRLVASHGIVVPAGQLAADDSEPGMPFPVIVKPAWEGSSKGIRSRCLVETPAELPGLLAELRRDYRQPLVVEEFVAGRELTVGVLGPAGRARVLGVMEVVPNEANDRFVYSLEVKRDYLQRVTYRCPAELTAAEAHAVESAALLAHAALGCRDVARLDFRLRGGVPYFIEANPLPGLNPESSDLVILAGLLGIAHGDLVRSILAEALARLSG